MRRNRAAGSLALLTQPQLTFAQPAETPISAGATSCQPSFNKEAWWSWWRMQSAPMNTPSRTRLRITAYHMVLASPLPWIRCQGFSGGWSGGATPASTSWRWVAT